jgi:asparagine N-glycosylation enzyme membrane subunit Stt3
MELIDVLHEYFRGEKNTGLLLVPIGALILSAAVVLWRTETGGFMWGLVAPLILLGLFATAVGTGLAIRTDTQVAELERQHREDPTAMVAAERTRMAAVNANWKRFEIAWTVIAIVAFGLFWGVERPWARGLGVALLLMAALLMLLDTFAERRADVYTRGLERGS